MNGIFKKVGVLAALEAGRLVRDSVGKVKKITYKGRINIVTDADKRSEAVIVRRLRRSFPAHSILSEESAPRKTRSSYKWVIDPIDGTTNFAHGFPFFCVSIALEKDGRTILGIVYDPMRDELFVAEEGKGAYLNNKKIRVSKTKVLLKSFLATGFAYGVKTNTNKNIKNFRNFLVSTQAIRRAGSAALDLCYVGCGRFDGFWEMYLHPWDSAAAILIVREAGGMVTKFNGSRCSHYDNQVLASNGLLHKQMVSVLAKK